MVSSRKYVARFGELGNNTLKLALSFTRIIRSINCELSSRQSKLYKSIRFTLSIFSSSKHQIQFSVAKMLNSSKEQFKRSLYRLQIILSLVQEKLLKLANSLTGVWLFFMQIGKIAFSSAFIYGKAGFPYIIYIGASWGSGSPRML